MPDAVLGTWDTMESKDRHSYCCYGAWIILGEFVGIIIIHR